jgi:outer membrane protein OmpA-like peptidoglycan-associated protein
MAARSWCVGCLLLGAADLAVMNLAVGPRVLAEVPLEAAGEPETPTAPATYAMAAAAPAQALPRRELRAEIDSTDEPSRPAGTPALTLAPTAPLATTDTGDQGTERTPALRTAQPESGSLSDTDRQKPADPDTVSELPTSPVVIYFATDRATLWPAAQSRLDEIAAVLGEHRDWSLQIAGHADARGSDDHNAQLSSRRVRRVREYLEARGVVAARVVGKAFGERLPAAAGADDEALHRNRRVEISFIRSQP